MGPIRLMGLIGLMGLMGLMGCSEDAEDAEDAGRVTIVAQPCATGFTEEADMSRKWDTRAWNPSPYVTYSTIYGANGMFPNQKNLVNKSIEVFFTKDGEAPLEGTFFFNEHISEGESKWRLGMDEVPVGDHYLYGYIPKEDAGSVEIAPNSSYSNGAVLTIKDLNTVTPSDVCVIIGAKEGTDAETVSDLQPGQFMVRTTASGTTGNYIFLLFDHIYTSLRFNFKVGTDYDKLRVIKLRKLELIACSDDQGTLAKAKFNAIITLKKRTTSTTPVIESIVFEPDNSKGNAGYQELYNWKNDPTKYVTLTTTKPEQFMGCFVPGNHTYFKLQSTYDVFDKQGNLIRQGCEAVNAIDLYKIFKVHAVEPGHMYSLTMTVQPTYLYVLSEPDLDNPTVTIEH